MNVPNYSRTHRVCPICGCTRAEFVYHYQDEMILFNKLPQEFDIVSCTACGFVYSDIATSQSIYDEYYSECSVYDNLGVTYGTVTDDHSGDVYAQRAKEISSFASRDASILEIGSANGLLLEELKKLGFENLSALDLSKESLDNLAQRGFRTHLGGIFSSAISDQIHKPLTEQFDCVCLTQVMEHIYDVQGAMRNMSQMLKPGGHLYIEVPDAGRFQDFSDYPICLFNYEHIGYFDEASMRNLASTNGLRIVNIIHKNIHFSTEQDVYPCVVGVFQKPSLARSGCGLTLKKYASEFEANLSSYENIIPPQEEVAIWGMGNFARQLLKEVGGRWNIKYLIDSNPLHQGKIVLGYPINIPEKLAEDKFSGTILITTSLYADEVADQIQNLGLSCHVKKMSP